MELNKGPWRPTMRVRYVDTTSKMPATVISLAAGTCYGKDDTSWKRVVRCYEHGHMSVFEHAHLTCKVEGISRACSHQLVRHRLASYSQQSQRYCKYDFGIDNWFVTPPDIWEDERKYTSYVAMMRTYAANYRSALESLGCTAEDARFLLPEATKTDIVISMNLREFYHFLDQRWTKQAQWEIRQLAEMMYFELRKYDGNHQQWQPLLDLWMNERTLTTS